MNTHMSNLIDAFEKEEIRNKRNAKNVMDCTIFIEVLTLYEKLKTLISSPQMIIGNKDEIDKASNEMKLYTKYDGINQDSCKSLDPFLIKQKIQSTKHSLGTIKYFSS